MFNLSVAVLVIIYYKLYIYHDSMNMYIKDKFVKSDHTVGDMKKILLYFVRFINAKSVSY